MSRSRIKKITLRNLWGHTDLSWDALEPDVNILVGINGSGKSTLLKIVASLLAGERKKLENYGASFSAHLVFDTWRGNGWEGDEVALSYAADAAHPHRINLFKPPHGALLSTFDAPVRNRERLGQEESSLDQELDLLIYQREKESPVNFTNYRLKATMPRYDSQQIAESIRTFFLDTINPLFAGTGKKIEIDENTNEVVFQTHSRTLKLTDLSSGEKQLLIILFRLFLMEKKEYVILMDEPELSLHIEWQQKLIDVMTRLNPNGQFIIATHSPSLFGKGWMCKMTRMENLKQ